NIPHNRRCTYVFTEICRTNNRALRGIGKYGTLENLADAAANEAQRDIPWQRVHRRRAVNPVRGRPAIPTGKRLAERQRSPGKIVWVAIRPPFHALMSWQDRPESSLE